MGGKLKNSLRGMAVVSRYKDIKLGIEREKERESVLQKFGINKARC